METLQLVDQGSVVQLLRRSSSASQIVTAIVDGHVAPDHALPPIIAAMKQHDSYCSSTPYSHEPYVPLLINLRDEESKKQPPLWTLFAHYGEASLPFVPALAEFYGTARTIYGRTAAASALCGVGANLLKADSCIWPRLIAGLTEEVKRGSDVTLAAEPGEFGEALPDRRLRDRHERRFGFTLAELAPHPALLQAVLEIAQNAEYGLYTRIRAALVLARTGQLVEELPWDYFFQDFSNQHRTAEDRSLFLLIHAGYCKRLISLLFAALKEGPNYGFPLMVLRQIALSLDKKKFGRRERCKELLREHKDFLVQQLELAENWGAEGYAAALGAILTPSEIATLLKDGGKGMDCVGAGIVARAVEVNPEGFLPELTTLIRDESTNAKTLEVIATGLALVEQGKFPLGARFLLQELLKSQSAVVQALSALALLQRRLDVIEAFCALGNALTKATPEEQAVIPWALVRRVEFHAPPREIIPSASTVQTNVAWWLNDAGFSLYAPPDVV